MPVNEDVDVVVSIKDDYLEQLDELTARLEAAGMRVDHSLPEIGIVTGRASGTVLDLIQELDGVEGVEVAREFELPPPDSPQ